MEEKNIVDMTLSQGGSAILFDVREDRPFIASFTDRGRIVAADSPLHLPEKAVIDGKDVPLVWRFTGSSRKDGQLNGVPACILTLSFECAAHRLFYRLSCAAREGIAGPFELWSELENASGIDIGYTAFPFFSVELTGGEPIVWQFKKESGYAEGMRVRDNGNPEQFFFTEGSGIYKTKLTEGTRLRSWVSTMQNFNSSGYIPMLYLDRGDRGGCCDYFALEWSSGSVRADAEGGRIRLSADLDLGDENRAFYTLIKSKTVFLHPSVYLGAARGDVDDCSNVFKKWFFACKAPRALRENPVEPLIQIDLQHSPEKAREIGVESLKWDYGWWSDEKNGDWKTLEGSWECRCGGNLNALKQNGGSMRSYGDRLAENGLNWTVYVLLHDTKASGGAPSDKYGEFNSITHPEWFTGHYITPDMGQSADLGNAECVAYLQKALTKLFGDNRIGTWRTDFEPIARLSHTSNRHFANGSDVQYWNTRGFGEVVDYIYSHLDGFRYESCSSGGSMKDLFTATKAVVINCDDLANYLSLRTTLYDGSYCIHPAQLQQPCNPDTFCTDCARHNYPVYDDSLRDAVKHMGMRSMMLGAIMFGSWCGSSNDELKYGLDGFYRQYFAIYKEKVRPLIRNGSLYHILPRPDGIHWDGMMYSDPNSETTLKGAAFFFKPSEEAGDSVTAKLRGLDPGVLYRVEFNDGSAETYTASGAALMEEGVTVSFKSVGSEIVWIYGPDGEFKA